jgi:hypothetical protein
MDNVDITIVEEPDEITINISEGLPGEGVPTGGSAGQVLVKISGDDYDTEWQSVAGTGDMLASVYDPDTIAGDAFDTDNHKDGDTNKVFTAIEKTKLSGLKKITISATEPSTPSVGDIWVDIS